MRCPLSYFKFQGLLALFFLLLVSCCMLFVSSVGCGPDQGGQGGDPPGPETPPFGESDLADPQGIIPRFILQKAHEFVISKVGKDFFRSNIKINFQASSYNSVSQDCIDTPNFCASYLREPYYLIVYDFKISEKSFVDEIIEFIMDEDGKVIPERSVYGLPDCMKDSRECEFPVSEIQARSIAARGGLQQGIRDWSAQFHWYGGEFNTYVWGVSTVLFESREPLEARGQEAIIDANSGVLIEILGWYLVE